LYVIKVIEVPQSKYM